MNLEINSNDYEKTMNIVIIGNGFDLYHKLPTRFSDFYLYYKNSTKNTAEKKSFSFIESVIESKMYLNHNKALSGTPFSIEKDWNNIEELFTCFGGNDYGSVLRNFNSCFVPYIKDICMPQIEDMKIIDQKIKKVIDESNLIINFNYTNTLSKYVTNEEYKEKIYHVHGNLKVSDDIVIGNGVIPELLSKISTKSIVDLTKKNMRDVFDFRQRESKNKYFDFISNINEYYDVKFHFIGHSIGKTDSYELKEYINFTTLENISIILYCHNENNVDYLKENLEQTLELSFDEVDRITSFKILSFSNNYFFPFFTSEEEFISTFEKDSLYKHLKINDLYCEFKNNFRRSYFTNAIHEQRYFCEFLNNKLHN